MSTSLVHHTPLGAESTSSHIPLPHTSLLPKWRVVATKQDKDDGYFGAAYLHEVSQQLIIAHRGTELSSPAYTPKATGILAKTIERIKRQVNSVQALQKDVHADIEGIIRLTVTSQQINALSFALSLKQQYPHYQISFRGRTLLVHG